MKLNKQSKYTRRISLVLILPFFITACGGGGGDSAATPTATAPETAAVATLSFSPIKKFSFSWTDVSDATFYRLWENPDGISGFTQISGDIAQGTMSYEHTVALYQRANASYMLQSCNATGCTDGADIPVVDTMEAAIGYFKASNTESLDKFGGALAISGDGNTLAVGSSLEDSDATTINGSEGNNAATSNSGAVYVFINTNGVWTQQAYIKPDNTGMNDFFGSAVSLSTDGNTLAVAADNENVEGAVYIFSRAASTWSQDDMLKGANTAGATDVFGSSVSLSGDGNTLAVGATGEQSDGSSAADNSLTDAGAVYVFTNAGGWSQDAYVKAGTPASNDLFGIAVSLSDDGSTLAVGGQQSGNGAVHVYTATGSWADETIVTPTVTGANDAFGSAVSLSSDGSVMAVGARGEDSDATTVDGDANDNDAGDAGAAYVFSFSGTWSQQAYFKAANAEAGDFFGSSVSVSDDGLNLVVGAPSELGNAVGVNGDDSLNTADLIGAVYVFKSASSVWSQQAYIKASTATRVGTEFFGGSVQFNGDASVLSVGSSDEDSNATGVGGNASDTSALSSGAVYLY